MKDPIKILNYALALTATFSFPAFACSDIFINKEGYHIEARTLDFFVNIAFEDKIGFVGDADKIPAAQLTSWKNKYGYFGRAAFNGEKVMDAMNTEGFSIVKQGVLRTYFSYYATPLS